MAASHYHLDRRLNLIQFNVQTEINILDDKIQRLAAYYQTLQSQVSDAEDNINRLNIKTNQILHLKKGKMINKKTDKQTIISKMMSDHQKIIHELGAAHDMRVKSLKEDFENTYEEIDKRIDQLVIEKCKPIENEIKRTIELINKMKQQPVQVDNSIDSAAEQEVERINEIENMRIQSYEAKLKEQNENRLNSLLEGKKQLQECVHTLEELENGHINKMEQLKDVLDNIDASYQEKVKRTSEKHKRDTSEIKRSIKEAQEVVKTISKSLSRTQKRQKDEILKATQESEYLRTELLTVKKKETQKREGDTDIQKFQKTISELNSKLRERESVLMKVRADNETLKKEIARILQEKQIAKRRAALHIT